MAVRTDIAEVQKRITNVLDRGVIGEKRIAAIVGDAPSHYSKSPALWNAAFARVGINAVYLPFDVDESRLRDLVSALKDCDRFMGMNVTVPHKVGIMGFLDQLDPAAERIRAVNTIVRTPAGRLIGYNTDGAGFVESILTPQPGRQESFMKSLKGIDVLLLGAGGSARAVAFEIAALLAGGQLFICNRTIEVAESLAEEIRKTGATTKAIGEKEIPTWAASVRLIINSTTKGQGGMRKLSNGRVVNLEPYSSLAPADPPAAPESESGAAESQSRQSNAADIDVNNQASLSLARTIPNEVHFYDLIYYPEETVFLRHGRETGHRTLNGKAMIVCQAAIAFCNHICKRELRLRGIDKPMTLQDILEIMYRAW